ncbi:MAG: hypothetical protein ACK4YP_26615 [Myxococcota bacterium]
MLLALALPLVACTPTPEKEDPEAHACEHVTEAGTTVVAGADPASAGAIAIGEEPYTVTLVEGAAGYVAIEVDEDTPALLFLGTADVAASLWHGEEEVGLSSPAPNDLCPDDIPEHYDLDLHEAGTWLLELGPAAVSDVWLLLSSAEGHGHE